jgi:hypothetical protein
MVSCFLPEGGLKTEVALKYIGVKRGLKNRGSQASRVSRVIAPQIDNHAEKYLLDDGVFRSRSFSHIVYFELNKFDSNKVFL